MIDKDIKLICKIDGVNKSYGGITVLSDVSLTVCSSEILGVKGLNGAGKSTLLKLIAGVLKPESGTIEIDNQLCNKIGYVPQEVALYEELTGLENLRFWGRVYGLDRREIEERAKWLLEQVELSDKAKLKVLNYSGGMKRRLHLITALIGSPKLLLLDEPTVGADYQSIEIIITLLENLRKNGCAIIMISHHVGELERVCSRIVVLDKGVKAERMEI